MEEWCQWNGVNIRSNFGLQLNFLILVLRVPTISGCRMKQAIQGTVKLYFNHTTPTQVYAVSSLLSNTTFLRSR